MTPQEIAAKFVAENAEAAAILRAEGSEAERARIQAVREQNMPGHEALIDGDSVVAQEGVELAPERIVRLAQCHRDVA